MALPPGGASPADKYLLPVLRKTLQAEVGRSLHADNHQGGAGGQEVRSAQQSDITSFSRKEENNRTSNTRWGRSGGHIRKTEEYEVDYEN